jgi:hypothetical protein
MKNQFMRVAAALLLVAGLSSAMAMAQTAPANRTQAQPAAGTKSPWKFYPRDRAIGDGGPAPKRDLNGTWAGPSSGMAVAPSRNAQEPKAPPLTPLGQQLFSMNKTLGEYSPAGTNDPHFRYCDPFGFPQNMTNEIRGMIITTLPERMFILIQYQDVWREIWTDGRALPTNVGAPGGLDPKYNGYSVGHWEDDYTFVIDTTGLDDKTWTAKNGYPHTMSAHVQERFHRDSKNDITLDITMDDPKLYTKQFDLGTEHFRWVPNQQLDDYTCIPSEIQEYLQTMGDPAGSDPNAARQAAAPQRGAAPAQRGAAAPGR